MKIYGSRGSRVIAFTAIVSAGIVAGGAGPTALAQGTGVAAQVSTPAAAQQPAASAPPATIGLPRLRDYEAIPELRDIYFDFGEAAIRPGDARILDANAAWLRANPDQVVLIEGHCDNRGVTGSKHEFNLALGERRAVAAMNYLVAQGVARSRIKVLSYGEERPLCAEDNERCWTQNRRSRFLVKPR
jgi:peptidoglycan-associated lipoprotein